MSWVPFNSLKFKTLTLSRILHSVPFCGVDIAALTDISTLHSVPFHGVNVPVVTFTHSYTTLGPNFISLLSFSLQVRGVRCRCGWVAEKRRRKRRRRRRNSVPKFEEREQMTPATTTTTLQLNSQQWNHEKRMGI